MPSLALDKLEVARRQLETAVEMYFAGGDPVSIHTLTMAAYEILDNYAKAKQLPRMNMVVHLEKMFPAEAVPRLRRLMRKPQNFFKHANEDPGDTIDFNPDQTMFPLLDACLMYPVLSASESTIMSAFAQWFTVVVDLPYVHNEEQAKVLEGLRHCYRVEDRAEFYRHWQTMGEKQKTGE